MSLELPDIFWKWTSKKYEGLTAPNNKNTKWLLLFSQITYLKSSVYTCVKNACFLFDSKKNS